MLRRAAPFRLQGFNLLWPAMSRRVQLEDSFVTSRWRPIAIKTRPATPKAQRIGPLTYFWFGLFRFRSPLLTESHTCFLFLQVLRCFSSLGWLPLAYEFSQGLLGFAQ